MARPTVTLTLPPHTVSVPPLSVTVYANDAVLDRTPTPSCCSTVVHWSPRFCASEHGGAPDAVNLAMLQGGISYRLFSLH